VRIFHIVDRTAWAAASEQGEYVPDGFARDGFVHFSFADQVARVANAIYRDEPDLIVVEVELPDDGVVVEDCYDAGEAFPHVYRPIPTEAAVAVHALGRTASGDWQFSAGDASGPANPDR
jgi:uncharacterized protein (DUF952 family)